MRYGRRADLLGRAHIIAATAVDEKLPAFSHSALERDANDGVA